MDHNHEIRTRTSIGFSHFRFIWSRRRIKPELLLSSRMKDLTGEKRTGSIEVSTTGLDPRPPVPVFPRASPNLNNNQQFCPA
ncbi:MAG: hypothetical protein CMJ81_06660 [Planctomycetaceae bacterium]|nr:hypothetical protein [Planctomycetaceae bacterium]